MSWPVCSRRTAWSLLKAAAGDALFQGCEQGGLNPTAAQAATFEIVEPVDLDAFWSLQEIASFFPLKFSGKAQWNEFTGHCNGCKEDVLDTHLRGEVRRIDGRTFAIKALGYCPSCDLLTPFMYHAHDDVSLTGKSPTSGQVARWAPGTNEQDLV